MLTTRTVFNIFMISLHLVTFICNGEVYNPAPICARNECPAYSVLQTYYKFEIRSYKDARWVYGPTVPSKSYKAAASKGFKILLDYYKGKNQQHSKINLIYPVLVRVENSSLYTVFFYLPQYYQKYAPRPLEKNISLVNLPLPGYKYTAVRMFDGFISDTSFATQLDALKKSLESTPYQRAASSTTKTITMLAAYNSNEDKSNIVNEVFIWFD